MKFSKKSILSFVIAALCLNGLVFLFFKIDKNELRAGFDGLVFWKAFLFTIYQASISAFVSVFLGILAAPGYAHLGKGRRFTRWVFLLPNLMSHVIVALCLILSFSDFPYGLKGILLGHIFINAGLCTVWLGEKWSELENQWQPISWVMGSSPWNFLVKVMLPLMKPQIKNTFAVIFSFCLASFAIPLVLGGGPQASTLEVLIYELIHSEANISWVSVLGIIQCLIQVSVFITILKPALELEKFPRPSYLRPKMSFWLLGPLFVGFISVYPLVPLIKMSLINVSPEIFNSEFLKATVLSFKVAGLVFTFSFLLLSLLMTFGWLHFLTHVPTVSGVVIGLSGLLIFRIGGLSSSTITCLALVWGQMAIIFVPAFRLSSSSIESIRSRFEKVFQQLGTTSIEKYRKVYLRLGFKTLFATSSLAACWSMGDFSLARTFGFAQNTLPVYVQNLLGSYRLEQAASSSLLLLLLTFVSLIFMEVLASGLG